MPLNESFKQLRLSLIVAKSCDEKLTPNFYFRKCCFLGLTVNTKKVVFSGYFLSLVLHFLPYDYTGELQYFIGGDSISSLLTMVPTLSRKAGSRKL
jgi:hypothetical protein